MKYFLLMFSLCAFGASHHSITYVCPFKGAQQFNVGDVVWTDIAGGRLAGPVQILSIVDADRSRTNAKYEIQLFPLYNRGGLFFSSENGLSMAVSNFEQLQLGQVVRYKTQNSPMNSGHGPVRGKILHLFQSGEAALQSIDTGELFFDRRVSTGIEGCSAHLGS